MHSCKKMEAVKRDDCIRRRGPQDEEMEEGDFKRECKSVDKKYVKKYINSRLQLVKKKRRNHNQT